MKLMLSHGRHDPNQDMDGWGFGGPELFGVHSMQSRYNHMITVKFHTSAYALIAKTKTGWDWFDQSDHVLEAGVYDDMLRTLELNGSGDQVECFYGDWYLTDE